MKIFRCGEWFQSLLVSSMVIVGSIFGMSAESNAQTPTTRPAWRPRAAFEVEAVAATLKPTRSVEYRKTNGQALSLHLFNPADLKPGDARPCFLVIHGGGWTGGDPQQFFPIADHFAKRGMIGISLQYTLNHAKGEAPFNGVKDARSAVRYLRTHARELQIDPDKIIVGGGSAGGHLAAGTALFDGLDAEGDDLKVSCAPNALVLYYAVIDISPEGYGFARLKEHAAALSPLNKVKPGVPPTILFHGTADTVTPFIGAERFVAAMKAAGNRCELVPHEGGEHGYFQYKLQLFEQTMARTETFLESLGYLKTDRPAKKE